MEHDKTNLFDAAKQISDILSKIQKPDQERVLRWVAESIGGQIGGGNLQPPATAPSHPAQHAPASAHPTAPTMPAGRAVDIKSFVQGKQPKSDMQFAAVVAYYYRFESPEDQRCETLAPDQLQDAARQAGRQRLANPRSTLNNAVTQGYLDRIGGGEFKINTVGENLVAMTLPSGNDNNGAVKNRNRKAKKKKATKSKKTSKKSKQKSGNKAEQ